MNRVSRFGGALFAAATCIGMASAADVLLKNDRLIEGGTVRPQFGFINNEIGAATYTIPRELFPIRVKQIQIFWQSQFGFDLPSVQEGVYVWRGGMTSNTTNNFILLYESDPVQMTDGGMNIVDISNDKLDIDAVGTGPQVLTFGLKFADAPGGNPLRATLVTDNNGCGCTGPFATQVCGQRINPLNSSIGWRDGCSFGLSGNFVIRAVITSLAACPGDYNKDGFLTFDDFDVFVTDFEAGTPSSDFNKDGFLTFEDFDGFVKAFETGCP
jgi:hypothetical protein